jgi:hypothetical protein
VVVAIVFRVIGAMSIPVAIIVGPSSLPLPYHKRAGDRTYRMEHYDIADMFGRRQRPRLELALRPRTGKEIVFRLKNTGRATARAPYLAISMLPPFSRSPFGIDGNRNEGIKHLVADSPVPPWRYPAKADAVIHPGVTLEIGCLWSASNNDSNSARGCAGYLCHCLRGNAACRGHVPRSGDCSAMNR